MFELTARHADAWNLAWFGLPDERLATGPSASSPRPASGSGATRRRSTITVGLEVRYPDLGAQARRPSPGRALKGSPEVIAAGPRRARGARRGPRHRGARPEHARGPGPVPRGGRRLPRSGRPAGLIRGQSSARFGASQRSASSTDMPLRCGVVLELVAPDPPEAEVGRLRMPEVVAADRGARQHRERLGQADAGPRLGVEQLEERPLLGVVRAGRVAGRRPDALVALGDEVLVGQAPRRARSPTARGGRARGAARRRPRPAGRRGRVARIAE